MPPKADSAGGSTTHASKAGPKKKSRVVLLDSYSLAFRAFFALPETLGTSSGQVTNAVFGFTSMLIKLEGEERPDAVIACWDKGAPQFRLDQYPAYKAGRSETPQTLRQQFPLIREVLEVLRIPVVELEGYEADDLLATLARRGREAGHHMVIVSGDRDCLQLVNDDVTVLMTRRGVTDMIRYDPAMVVERYGVGPERWTDFAALKGEQADNLPGVPGVGDKTAAKLLKEYGDIEGIIEHAAELTPKIRKGIETCADQAKLNRTLGRLLDDVPLETDESLFMRRAWDPETVRNLFTSFEFKTLYQRLLALTPDAAPAEEAVIRPSSISHWTSGADIPAAESVAVAWDDGMAAFCARPGEVGVLPFDVAAGPDEVLAAEDTAKVVYEAKPLCGAMLRHGARLRGVSCDLKIAAYLLDPGASGGYALKDIVSRYLDAALDGEAADAEAPGARAGLKPAPTRGQDGEAPDGGSQGDLLNPGDEDREQAARRRRLAAEAAAVQAAAPVLEARLREAGSWELARTLEFPLTEVLARMEHAGILVDDAYLSGLNQDLGERMTLLQAKVQEHAGESFNVNSHPQLTHILFDKLGLPKTKKIKTGYSTDAAELGKLAGRHPIIDTLLEYREVAKLRTGFTDSLLSLVNAQTGRIPHHLRAGRRRHRPAIVLGAESPEHPDSRRSRAADPPGLRGPAGQRAAFRRLFPDRAAGAGAPVRGRELSGGLRPGPRLPRHHRGQGVRGGPPGRHLRDARPRQAVLLRHRLRHVRVRGVAAAGHRGGRGPGIHRRLLRPVSGGQGVPGRAGGAGQGRRFHHHHVRPAALSAGASVHQLPHAGGGGAHGPQRADPGHCGRHHEAGDDRRGPGAPGGAGGAHAAHGP